MIIEIFEYCVFGTVLVEVLYIIKRYEESKSCINRLKINGKLKITD